LRPASNIIRVIKLRKMRWAGHTARAGETTNAYNIWLDNLNGRDHLEDPDVYEKTISEWTLGKYGGRVWTGCIWLRIETSGKLL
jgi:hypothetical protein